MDKVVQEGYRRNLTIMYYQKSCGCGGAIVDAIGSGQGGTGMFP